MESTGDSGEVTPAVTARAAECAYQASPINAEKCHKERISVEVMLSPSFVFHPTCFSCAQSGAPLSSAGNEREHLVADRDLAGSG
jgi:hypothetical protein